MYVYIPIPSLYHINHTCIYMFFLFTVMFFLFTVIPAAYGSSQARERIGAATEASTTDTATMSDLSHICHSRNCKPKSSWRQCWVLNLLNRNGGS